MRKLVVLSLLTTALLGISSVSAMAQAPADGWQVTVAPYLLGAGVTGTTAIGPLTDGVSLDLGYRWIGTDYESGEGVTRFSMDTITQGPVLGFAFKF
jgi:opacity protein-like surface antigen